MRGGTCTPGDSWDGHRDRRHEAIAAAAHSLNDLLCVRPIADGFASRHDAADQGGIAGRKIKLAERIDGLLRWFQDVEQPFVSTNLELLA